MLKRKTAHSANNKALEDTMYVWFTKMRNLGEPISGLMIYFKASSGCLKNFKCRHGIRELDWLEVFLKRSLLRKHLKKVILGVTRWCQDTMVCANASGENELKLLVIGKSKKPHCFKNVQMLPVSYMSQKSV
ncbi:hypothetical protein PR048_001970 [Dryococelus australis]|uniref:DDE-1 domain-containing protein n=1 Tax=Dryococelus australis TaxID=614101 RepID=A0ABQ9IIY1_9NEOP|nr:hypothetical protein PR048_001970 [Dryococelus australis]